LSGALKRLLQMSLIIC